MMKQLNLVPGEHKPLLMRHVLRFQVYCSRRLWTNAFYMIPASHLRSLIPQPVV